MKQNIKRLIAFLTVFWCAFVIFAYAHDGIEVIDMLGIVFWLGVSLIIKKIADSVVNAVFQIIEKDEK
jgi:hypothetical protein